MIGDYQVGSPEFIIGEINKLVGHKVGAGIEVAEISVLLQQLVFVDLLLFFSENFEFVMNGVKIIFPLTQELLLLSVQPLLQHETISLQLLFIIFSQELVLLSGLSLVLLLLLIHESEELFLQNGCLLVPLLPSQFVDLVLQIECFFGLEGPDDFAVDFPLLLVDVFDVLFLEHVQLFLDVFLVVDELSSPVLLEVQELELVLLFQFLAFVHVPLLDNVNGHSLELLSSDEEFFFDVGSLLVLFIGLQIQSLSIEVENGLVESVQFLLIFPELSVGLVLLVFVLLLFVALRIGFFCLLYHKL